MISRIQFPKITRSTKYKLAATPLAFWGPPCAFTPLYITEFQSSPVSIYCRQKQRKQEVNKHFNKVLRKSRNHEICFYFYFQVFADTMSGKLKGAMP